MSKIFGMCKKNILRLSKEIDFMVKDKLTFVIAGVGYVGMSMVVLISPKYSVIAVDISEDKVEMINSKISPIQDDYIAMYLAEEELVLAATTDAENAIKRPIILL